MTTSATEALIGGFTLAQWETRWAHIPGGFADPPRNLVGKSGLYRVVLNGETIAIGKSSGGGGSDLKKRISDFTRPSASARNYQTGEFVNANYAALGLMVLVTGSGRAARDLAAALKNPMTALHRPRGNLPAHIVAAAMKG
jgi:hypothetical protein